MTAVGDAVPTGEDVGRVHAEHKQGQLRWVTGTGWHVPCTCGVMVTFADWQTHLADVVTALYAPVVEQGARDRAAVEAVLALHEPKVSEAFGSCPHCGLVHLRNGHSYDPADRLECTECGTLTTLKDGSNSCETVDAIRAALDVTEPPSEGEA